MTGIPNWILAELDGQSLMRGDRLHIHRDGFVFEYAGLARRHPRDEYVLRADALRAMELRDGDVIRHAGGAFVCVMCGDLQYMHGRGTYSLPTPDPNDPYEQWKRRAAEKCRHAPARPTPPKAAQPVTESAPVTPPGILRQTPLGRA